MARAKIFLAAPVCVVIAGVDAMVNPPEKYHPERQLAKVDADSPEKEPQTGQIGRRAYVGGVGEAIATLALTTRRRKKSQQQ